MRTDIVKELLWILLCCFVCFCIGGVSAWLATTEDFDRAARQGGKNLDYQSMHSTAALDFLKNGSIFVLGGIPLYGLLFYVRTLARKGRNSD